MEECHQSELSRSFPFLVASKEIDDGIKLTQFDVKDIKIATSYIDEKISQIYGGPTCSATAELTKKRLAKRFKDKSQNIVYGAAAEFFSHLFLNDAGYRQDFLYKNLEEGSVKKGFDGLYSTDDEIWLMESKSGDASKNATHTGKVKEAFADIRSKLSDTDKNDPWENALSHARLADSSGSIIKQIEKLSDSFAMGEGTDVSEFSIIPCATVYYTGECPSTNIDELAEQIRDCFKNDVHGLVHVICVSNSALESFLHYLGIGENDE